jgi:N-acetylmuramoyl-L-alanine amidase
MARVLLTCAVSLALAAAALASDWQLIKLQGRDYVTLENVAEFYGLNQIRRVKNDITLSTNGKNLRGKSGSNEFYINNLKFILSYPIAETSGKLLVSRMDLTKVIDPVLRPSRIRNAEMIQTVVLDPGHGGHDHGARSRFGSEKIFTLKVATELDKILTSQGYQVVLTRTSDDFVPLEDRARIANRFKNALLVSLHFNSGPSHASGMETYTLAPRGVPSTASDGPRESDLQPCRGNARDAENMALATATHASLTINTHLYDRGIKRARFVVIRNINIPGVLIEAGFLSNSSDSRKIATTAFQQQIARSIAQAIANYRNAIGRKPELLASGRFAVHNVDSASAPTVASSTRNEPLVVTPTSR